jgi:hypothetical protein
MESELCLHHGGRQNTEKEHKEMEQMEQKEMGEAMRRSSVRPFFISPPRKLPSVPTHTISYCELPLKLATLLQRDKSTSTLFDPFAMISGTWDRHMLSWPTIW